MHTGSLLRRHRTSARLDQQNAPGGSSAARTQSFSGFLSSGDVTEHNCRHQSGTSPSVPTPSLILRAQGGATPPRRDSIRGQVSSMATTPTVTANLSTTGATPPGRCDAQEDVDHGYDHDLGAASRPTGYHRAGAAEHTSTRQPRPPPRSDDGDLHGATAWDGADEHDTCTSHKHGDATTTTQRRRGRRGADHHDGRPTTTHHGADDGRTDDGDAEDDDPEPDRGSDDGVARRHGIHGRRERLSIGAIALMLMTSGSGLLWAGSRRKRDQDQDEE